MTNGVFILFGLIMILVILVIMRRPDKKENEPQTDDIKNGYTLQETQDFLEWMFKLGIIDVMEYNEKLKQCLPFTEQRRSN